MCLLASKLVICSFDWLLPYIGLVMTACIMGTSIVNKQQKSIMAVYPFLFTCTQFK